MPHFTKVLILYIYLLNLSWRIKCLKMFEKYGAFYSDAVPNYKYIIGLHSHPLHYLRTISVKHIQSKTLWWNKAKASMEIWNQNTRKLQTGQQPEMIKHRPSETDRIARRCLIWKSTQPHTVKEANKAIKQNSVPVVPLMNYIHVRCSINQRQNERRLQIENR